MAYGYNGKILVVDLSTRSTEVLEMGEQFYRRYLGGKGFAGYFLLKDVPGGADPLGPENVLVVATGVLGGAPVSGLSRYTVAAKSPLTGAYGESEAGGWFAPELKAAGFDAVVVRGASPTPVYLWIHDGEVEIRDAAKIWGLEIAEAQDAIREDSGEQKARMILIGPAGEKLVRYACVSNEMRHYNGRTGTGAVMGSKNLKAIAVRGSPGRRPELFDPDKVKSLAKWFAGKAKDSPVTKTLHDAGTPSLVIPLDRAGILPTRNFLDGTFEQAEDLCWDVYEEEFFSGAGSCYACTVACKRQVEHASEKLSLDSRYGGPEYEGIGALGAACGVGDLAAVMKANELCARYGTDVISTGASIAFAMECFENGLIGEQDTGGIELRFGSGEAMVQMVEQICKREGLGQLLGEGVRRAAEKIGKGAERFALHVKGQELPMHDPRGKVAVGLGYALSETGADHLVIAHDPLYQNPDGAFMPTVAPLGILNAMPSTDLSPEKIRFYYYAENIVSLGKVLDLCYFVFVPRTPVFTLDRLVELVNAVTGWQTSLWELMKAGERGVNLARAFNVREGFSRADDMLPDRLFEELRSGRLKGTSIDRKEFEDALTLVYEMKGWDPETARPKRAKLVELDIGWVYEAMEEGGQ